MARLTVTRVEPAVVVHLREHEASVRHDLEHGVHGRAQATVRIERGDESLAAPEFHREAIDIARAGGSFQPSMKYIPLTR